MADSIKVHGLKELRTTLKAIDKGLPAQLNAELRRVAEPIRTEAARLAPRSNRAVRRQSTLVRARRTSSIQISQMQRVPHIADTLRVGVRGDALSIYSNRTGAGVIHWGGRHPLFGDRDHWYQQKPTLFAVRAIEDHIGQVERDIGDTLERLWGGLH